MPIPGLISARPIRAALLVLALGTAMGGCSLLGLDKDDASNDLNKDAAEYRERPVEAIYADGWNQINKGNWKKPPSSSTKWTASIPIRCGRAVRS